jgi:hypothetical protein
VIDIEAMAPDELRRRLRETMADNDRLRRTLEESPAVQSVERLRALLAEARGVVDEGLDRSVPSVIQRIDAALAESANADTEARDAERRQAEDKP